ncbi:hypothetical protein JBF12_46685, partial [Streptomyces javensis]|nr:hypothetical protein [Streptomyces javensis]
IKSSIITQDFVHGADYAALAEAAHTFRGLLGEGAKVLRGEGERQREEKVGDFRQAMAWLIKEAERTTSRQRYKGLGEMNPNQLRESTIHPDTRRLVQLTVDDGEQTRSLMDMLLAKKRASDRKGWLESKGDLASLEV